MQRTCAEPGVALTQAHSQRIVRLADVLCFNAALAARRRTLHLLR